MMEYEIEWPYFKIKAITLKEAMDKGISRVYDPKRIQNEPFKSK